MKILFLGEHAGASAEYVRDCLIQLGHDVSHINAGRAVPEIKEDYQVILISDYLAKDLGDPATREIIKQVENGTRLIMLGGWGSFNGRGGNYYQHPLSGLLPVILNSGDDRMNAAQGLVLFPDPGLKTELYLDWNEPPVICGYNQALPREKARVLIWMKPVQTDGSRITLKAPLPFLIKGLYGKGTAMACLTDLAPHWCGGLVDWGKRRLRLSHVEIGEMFLLFVQLLLEA